MHVISLPMIFIFLSYERKEASVGVTTVASSTAGTKGGMMVPSSEQLTVGKVGPAIRPG